ncbi:MAG: hypothetical protein HOG19_12630, partial [Gammaproteobacteria bacterium]|nr:hypothetical protein [Gammaproteobacteria bacterium]
MAQKQPYDLDKTLQKAGVWRASHMHAGFQPEQKQGTPTGFSILDEQLSGSG